MIKLTDAMLDAAFSASNQFDALVALYRIAFPDWDRIARIDHWPSVSRSTNMSISKRFIVFDHAHHPDIVNGGLWMNSGFSTNDSVPDGMIDISTCTVELMP